jgi:C1A family cysteine protease
MCFLYPKVKAFSRLQIYYNVRQIEGDVNEDAGVETRDVLRVLQMTGAAPETLWPFNPKKMFTPPTERVYMEAEKYTVAVYSRLLTADDYLGCLAQGFPFVLGFTVFENLDSDQVEKTGVLPYPEKGDREIGGHDVLVVGYDTNFHQNPDFLKSGLRPDQVSTRALLIRNSWGTGWGLKGHFWLPLEFAADEQLGGDAWTARLTPQEKKMANKVEGMKIDPDEINVAAQAIRAKISGITYMGMNVGSHVTDEQCRELATAVVAAVESFRSSPSI